MVNKEYVLIYTPYITRKGVRIWASQYGLKAFCLKIPREKYRRQLKSRGSVPAQSLDFLLF